jgi:hypothetical protein
MWASFSLLGGVFALAMIVPVLAIFTLFYKTYP